MKIWHFSDSHTYHKALNVPECDLVIFSGDCSNPPTPYLNEPQVMNFIEWFGSLPIKYKVAIAGNHDTSIEQGLINRYDFNNKGIIYLENESVEIEGLKIWGSPYTPAFGKGWAYNERRDRLHELWATIPNDSDIVITHGPAKGTLDLAYHYKDNHWELEYCGCATLRKRINDIEPKLFCFGHIHNNEDNINSGVLKYSNIKTLYSNGSVMTDARFSHGPTSNGNLFNYENGVMTLIS